MVIASLVIQNASSNDFVGTYDRFNELQSRFGDESKRCQDMDDDQPLPRKKFKRCEEMYEFLGGASTSGTAIGCSEFDGYISLTITP